MKKAIFYYLPYAGASAMSFKNMKDYFSEDINTACLDYSGHGKRIEKKSPDTVSELVEDIFRIITQNDYEIPIYIGGHCLGGLAAYEVYILIKKAGLKPPARLFISGQGAPDNIISEKLQTMSEDELLNYLSERKLIDANMTDIRYRSLVEDLILKPVINDSIIYDNYVFSQNTVVDVPIDIFYGENDYRYSLNSLKQWGRFTTGKITIHKFNGDHYFLRKQEKEYFEKINTIIGKDIR